MTKQELHQIHSRFFNKEKSPNGTASEKTGKRKLQRKPKGINVWASSNAYPFNGKGTYIRAIHGNL